MKIARPTFGVLWLAVPLSMLFVYGVLGFFDTNTELTPSHESVLDGCFALGGFGSLIFMSVAIFGRQQIRVWNRLYLAFALALLGFLSVFLLSSRLAEIIENHIDFPPQTTKTFQALLAISRSYWTHGKGESWNIQTMPIWSNLNITEADYKFMLSHRSSADMGHNPDEISSAGYFCAKVMVQQAGSAIRVLNAGSNKLPKGSVIICPSDGSLPVVPYW